MNQANILITGGAGQVGQELLAHEWRAGFGLLAPTREALDLADAEAVAAFFEANAVCAIINAAAYTAVDRAEEDAAGAFTANALIPAILADIARRRCIPLIHVSTDYVFDGSRDGWYQEGDPPSPLGVYGASKRAGELAVLSACPRSVILRTAWVVSTHRTNFVKTMLRLGAIRPSLGVVADQFGCPTSATDIAEALATIALRMLDDEIAPTGVYHFVNEGDASWFDLATAVFSEAGLANPPMINPLTTAEYPTPARRPANSRLATTKFVRDFHIQPRPWRTAVAEITRKLAQKDITV